MKRNNNLINNQLTITINDIENNNFITYNKYYNDYVYVSINLNYYDNKKCNFEDKTLNNFDNLLNYLFFNNKYYIIENLTLNYCHIENINDPIIKLLKKNQLKYLNLNSNYIKNIDSLIEVLKHNTSLKELYLINNYEFIYNFDSFKNVIKYNKTLTHIEIFDNVLLSKNLSLIKPIIEALKYNITIEYMDFNKIKFKNDEEINDILSLLQYNNSIIELNLSSLYTSIEYNEKKRYFNRY